MNKNEIQKSIDELGSEQSWNHNIVLLDGLETSPSKQVSHGKNLVKWERIAPILDQLKVSGKRVIDIGCNEGFFTFKLAEKGASVLGGDIDSLRIKKAKFASSILQNKNVEFREIDIYSEEFQNLEKFDLCLCMGFLHRVPDPFRAIEAISHKADIILFEWKALKHGLHDEPYAYFSPKDIDHKDFYGTEYWLLSYAALESILQRLGYKYFYRIDDPRQRRALLVAGKVENPIFSQADVILHRGRIPALLSHTKRYIKTIIGVITGRLNS